ncbi:serine/threonine protein kinase [Myxococcota bacterium]|nr:serine/threonine protein kinase [Myxococcota bacterium]
MVATPVQILVLASVAQCFLGAAGLILAWNAGIEKPAFPLWQILAFGMTGLALRARGARDLRASRLGALFLVIASSFAVSLIAIGQPYAAPLHSAVAGVLVRVPADAFLPWVFWRLLSEFPRVEGRPRWWGGLDRGARVVTVAAGFFLIGVNLFPSVGGLGAVFDRLARDSQYWTLSFGLMVPSIVVSIWNTRRASAAERARVFVFFFGVVLAAAPVIGVVLLQATIPAFDRWFEETSLGQGLKRAVIILLLSMPLTAAYSVVVDRVFDVRLALKMTLRHGLARGIVGLLVVLPFSWVVWQLVDYREVTVSSLFSGERLILLGAPLIIGIVALRLRHRAAEAIDRAFFRSRYDARRVITDVTQHSRLARSSEELARTIVDDVTHALHPEPMAVYLADRTSGALLARSGQHPALPLACLLGRALETDDALVDLVAAAKVRADEPTTSIGSGAEPVVSSPAASAGSSDGPSPGSASHTPDAGSGVTTTHKPPSWRDAALTEYERAWISTTGFELLVPMRSAEGELLGCIALGPRKSGLPYSDDDRLLLSAVGQAGAIGLERHETRARRAAEAQHPMPSRSERARECGPCGLVQAEGSTSSTCSACGGGLIPSPIPRILPDKFLFERRIGRGGMGVVYRAIDLTLDRVVAVKTLPARSPEESAHLRHEARAMARVAHPNLALIYGAETWEGAPLLIVEYLAGGSLDDHLQKNGAMPPRDVVDLGLELLSVLVQIHGAGILHRDIKPSNLGRTAEGRWKLMDFGIAHMLAESAREPGPAIERVTRPGQTHVSAEFAGTPLYMSPEALMNRAPDPAVDLWATAMLMYEALAGVHPLAGAPWPQTLSRLLRADVPPLRTLVPDCPPALATLLQAALHRDPKKRPADAQTFEEQLRAIRDQPNPPSPGTPEPQR